MKKFPKIFKSDAELQELYPAEQYPNLQPQMPEGALKLVIGGLVVSGAILAFAPEHDNKPVDPCAPSLNVDQQSEIVYCEK